LQGRREEYERPEYNYITDGTYDLVWSDRVGEWRMSTSAQGMKSCIELDKVDRELDELGCEIIIGKFHLDPDKYKLEQIKYMNPRELQKLSAL